jgi:hypothetical protein
MGRAVHWFHTEALSLDFPHENVFFVSCVVTRCLPKFKVENVGRKHFLVATNTVLLSNQLDKFVVNFCTMRVEESAAG